MPKISISCRGHLMPLHVCDPMSNIIAVLKFEEHRSSAIYTSVQQISAHSVTWWNYHETPTIIIYQVSSNSSTSVTWHGTSHISLWYLKRCSKTKKIVLLWHLWLSTNCWWHMSQNNWGHLSYMMCIVFLMRLGSLHQRWQSHWELCKSLYSDIVYKYYLFMSLKVEIYPRGERLDCSISQAGRRMKWAINLSPSGYHFNLYTNLKQLVFVFISLLHKFHNIIYNLSKLQNCCKCSFFFSPRCCGLKRLPNIINQLVLARAHMRCMKTFDSFCFQMYLQT